MGFRSKLKPNAKKLMSTLHKTKGYVLFHPFPHITLFLTFIAEGGSLPRGVKNFAFGENKKTSCLAKIRGGSH